MRRPGRRLRPQSRAPGRSVPARRPSARDRARRPDADHRRTVASVRRWPVCPKSSPGARAACSTLSCRRLRRRPPCICSRMPSRAPRVRERPSLAPGSVSADSKTCRSSGGRRRRSQRRATTGARASSSRATARCSSPWAIASAIATQAQDLVDDDRQGRPDQPRRHVPKDNPFVGTRRRAARDLVVRPSQRAGGGAASARRARCGRSSTARAAATSSIAPQAGKNYGWPVITYGVDYSGAKIGEGTARSRAWSSRSTTGIRSSRRRARCSTPANAYPGWKGEPLRRLAGGRTGAPTDRWRPRDEEARYLPDIGRVRDVEQGPDGLLYLAIDSSNGAIIRLDPTQ